MKDKQPYWSSGNEIPKDRLTPENPIEHYKDILLYEDDLGDFGYSQLRVRLRAQKDSIFILLRSYVRVDQTSVRILDNRFFIDFNDFQENEKKGRLNQKDSVYSSSKQTFLRHLGMK
jgi:hypothetical protein